MSTTYNITDIYKQVSNIGYTEYVNIADGTKRTVRWGQLEWLGFAGSLTFMSGAVYLALKLAKVI